MKEITIDKPIFGSNIAIRDIKLKDARIKVRIGSGEWHLVDTKVWKQTGKIIKKVFLIPDKPMVLYQNYLDKFPLYHDDEWTMEGRAKQLEALKVALKK